MESFVAEGDGAAAEHRVDQFGGECFGGGVEQARCVGQPRLGVQVALDLIGGDPVANHEREGEDPRCAVP